MVNSLYGADPLRHVIYRLRSKAHGKVQTAIRNGILPRLDEKSVCVDCLGKATEYDHRDYREPLKVEPVCRRCNKIRGNSKDIELMKAER